MTHWRELDSHPRRESILLAIGEHDNGWREPDASPSLDPASGRAHELINAPAAVRQGVWPRGVERLSHDPWAAALVAEHALTVYDRYRSDPVWSEFFQTMATMRDELLTRIGRPLPELEHEYPVVRIGDLISLVFCNPWREETYRQWTFRFERDVITVTPWAFDVREVAFEIDAIELPDRRFASGDELRCSRCGLARRAEGRRASRLKQIPFTNFPLEKMTLWCAKSVIYVPSEH
jgi:hypothetical protein